MNPTEFRSLLENKLNKEFLTNRQEKQKDQKASRFPLARLAGETSLARNNLDFPMRMSIPLSVKNINMDNQNSRISS